MNDNGFPSHNAHLTERKTKQWLIIAVVSMAQLMVTLDLTIVNVALPSIRRDLVFNATNLQWVVNAYALTFGGFLLLGGRAGDRLGRRRMFMAGVCFFTAASIFGGFASGQAWLLAARAAQGIGAAVIAPTALAVIPTAFEEGPTRDRALGIYAATSAAGGAFGLLLGGVLTDLISWRWVFFVNAPIGIIAAIAARRTLPNNETKEVEHLDVVGALAITAAMSLLVYGLVHAANGGWSNTFTISPLLIATILVGIFVRVESRTTNAMIPRKLIRNSKRAAGYGVMFCLGAGIFSLLFFVTQFYQNILGYTPIRAGLAFLPVSAGIVFSAALMSRLIARIGPELPMIVGPLVGAVGLLWLSRIGIHSGYVIDLLGPSIVVAIALGMTFVALTVVTVSGVSHEQTGIASALLNVNQQLGGSLGLAILVTVAASTARGFKTLSPAVATTHGYVVAFRIGVGILIGASILGLVAARVRSGAPRQSISVASDLQVQDV